MCVSAIIWRTITSSGPLNSTTIVKDQNYVSLRSKQFVNLRNEGATPADRDPK